MPHIMILIFFIALSMGIIALTLFIIRYQNRKEPSIKYFLIFFLIITARILFNTIFLYIELNFSLQNRTELALFYAAKEMTFILVFIIPFIFHSLLSVPFIKPGNIILIGIIILVFILQSSAFIQFPLGNSVIYFVPDNNFLNILLLIIMVYPPVLVLIYYHKLKSIEIKQNIKLFTLFYIIFIVFDSITSWQLYNIPNRNSYLNQLPLNWLNLIFYFLWNLLLLIYSIKPLISAYPVLTFFQPNESIMEKYGITAQERNIINCLAKGHNNLKIAEENFISVNTVKKHIRNIYQKMNIKNRVELLNLTGLNKSQNQ